MCRHDLLLLLHQCLHQLRFAFAVAPPGPVVIVPGGKGGSLASGGAALVGIRIGGRAARNGDLSRLAAPQLPEQGREVAPARYFRIACARTVGCLSDHDTVLPVVLGGCIRYRV